MKIWNYVFLAIGLSLLFEYAGLTSGGILTLIGYSRNAAGVITYSFSGSSFWSAVLGSAGLWVGIAGGVIIGTLTRSSPENFIILPFITGTLGLFIQSFYQIVAYTIGNSAGWIIALVILLLGPVIPLFIVALVEFFRGTD